MQREYPGNRSRVAEFIGDVAGFCAPDTLYRNTLEGTPCCKPVGPGQPTRAELRPTEVSRDYAHGIDETCCVDFSEDGPTSSPGRLAVVVGAEAAIGQSNCPHVVGGIMVVTSLDIAHRQTFFEGPTPFDNRQEP